MSRSFPKFISPCNFTKHKKDLGTITIKIYNPNIPGSVVLESLTKYLKKSIFKVKYIAVDLYIQKHIDGKLISSEKFFSIHLN